MSFSPLDTMDRKPRLRLLEEIPVRRGSEPQVCLRDPSGIARSLVFLPLPVYFMVKQLDGEHTLKDIQRVFFRMFAELVPTERIAEIVEELEKNYFLEGELFEEYRQELEADFRRATVRNPAHAGSGYEEDPEKLRDQIESFFLHPNGPGTLPTQDSAPGGMRPFARAIVAPHIDLRVGGPCAARAYRALGESAQPDVYLVLGTCHAPMRNLFILSSKDYATPLGSVPVDRDLVEPLARRSGRDLFGDEIAHRQEHSIEFQTVFLAYLNSRRGARRVPMVPILCGSFDRMVRAGRDPLEDPEVSDFVLCVREVLAESGKRVCLIAGADLAHVGLKFGDPEAPSRVLLDRVKAEDLELLSHVESVDPAGFFQSIEKGKDHRRICGFPPIYALLAILGGGRGKLLGYEQWNDEVTPSTVSFASVVIY